MIIEDYLQSGLTKREIWQKHTGQSSDHGLILYWMYKYGYLSDYKEKSVTFAPKIQHMDSKHHKQVSGSEDDFETLQLKKRIIELERQLQESEMKSIAWQTMVEIAEREFHISIKKKFNTKPLQK
jgi:hypothetical protein